MNGEQFDLMTKALKEQGIAWNDTHLAKLLGVTRQTIANLRQTKKVPKVYQLACAALYRRVDPLVVFGFSTFDDDWGSGL